MRGGKLSILFLFISEKIATQVTSRSNAMMHRNPTCPGCSYSFTIKEVRVHTSKQPLLLQCGHACCESCLLKATKTNKTNIVCPSCRNITDLTTAEKGVKSLSPDIYVNGILHLSKKSRHDIDLVRLTPAGSASQKLKKNLETGVLKSKICRECMKNWATCRCLKCDCIMCGFCFDKIHALANTLRHHQAQPLEDSEDDSEIVLQSTAPTVCAEHENRPIEFFCEDDKVLTCSRCVITGDHKGHNVTSLEDKNKAILTELEPVLQTTDQVLRRLKKSEKKLMDLEPDYSTETTKLVEEVKSHCRWLHGLIQIRELDLIRDIHNAYAAGATQMQELRSKVMDEKKKLEGLIRAAHRCMNNNNEVTLLSDTAFVEKFVNVKDVPCTLVTRDKPAGASLRLEWCSTIPIGLREYGDIVGNVEPLVRLVSLAESGPDLRDNLSESESVISSTVDDSDVIIEEEREESIAESVTTSSKKTASRQNSEECIRHVPRSRAAHLLRRSSSGKEEVEVTHIKDPSHFMVQKCSDGQAYRNLQKNIQKWCKSEAAQKHVLTQLSAGEIILCKYTQDDTWYRACVKKVHTAMSTDYDSKEDIVGVDVLYFDYGNAEVVTKDRILKMQPKFMQLADYAMECGLSDIVPLESEKSWSMDAINTFFEMTNHKRMYMIVMEEVNNVLQVDLCKPPTDDIVDDRPVSVRDALVFLELANFKSKSHISSTFGGHIPNRVYIRQEQKLIGENFEALVTHCKSPEDFYLQELGSDAQYLSAMMIEMQKVYSADQTGVWNILCPRKGMICVAQFSGDSQWYRAQVLDLPGHRQVYIQYVDYGNTETLPITKLKKLLDKFLTLATFAVHCRMVDVKPVCPEDGWLEEAKGWCISNILHTQCSVKVIQCSYEGKIGVQMVAVIDDLQYCVNWKLVRDEVAVSTGPRSVIPSNAEIQSAKIQEMFLCPKKVVQAAADTITDLGLPQVKPVVIKLRSGRKVRRKKLNIQDYEIPQSISSSSSTSSLHTENDGRSSTERGMRRHRRSKQSCTPSPHMFSLNSEMSASQDSDKDTSNKSSSKEDSSLRETARDTSLSEQAEPTPKPKTPEKKEKKAVPAKKGRSPYGLVVTVCHFESPSCLYLQLETAGDDGLDSLMEEMEKEYSSQVPSWLSWKENDYCAVHRVTDGRWYRGQIKEVIHKTLVKVVMVDFGTVEDLVTNDLQKLKERFMNRESYAMLCHLANIQPTGDITKWSRTALEFVPAEILNKTCYLVKKGDKEDSGSQPIDLLLEVHVEETALEPASMDFYSLCEKLKQKGLAMPMRRNLVKREPVKELVTPVCPMATALALAAAHNPNKDKGEERASSPTEHVEPLIMLKPPCVYYKPPELPTKTTLEVIPTYVDYGCIIHVHVVGQSDPEEEVLGQVNKAMQVYFKKPSIYSPTTDWQVGQACAAFFGIDQHWYRAKVIDVPPAGNKIRVQYLDYGNSLWLTYDKVRADVEQFIDIPQQSLECRLHKVEPLSEQHGVWTAVVLENIHDMIVNKQSTIELQVIGVSGNPLSVCLSLPGGQDLTDILVDMSLAVRIVDFEELQQLSKNTQHVLEQKNNYQRCVLPEVGTKFTVIVTHVEMPDVVYFQHMRQSDPWDEGDKYRQTINQELGQLEHLAAQLSMFARTAKLFEKPHSGAPCCAQYSFDSCWYRALIISVKEEKVHVFFVDYGNSEFVHFDRLRILPAHYMILPAQATRCKILGIEPPAESSWNKEHLEAMVRILGSRDIVAHLQSCTPQVSAVFYNPINKGEHKREYAYQSLLDQGLFTLQQEADILSDSSLLGSPDKRAWAVIVEAEEADKDSQESNEDKERESVEEEEQDKRKRRMSEDSEDSEDEESEDSEEEDTEDIVLQAQDRGEDGTKTGTGKDKGSSEGDTEEVEEEKFSDEYCEEEKEDGEG